MSDEQNEDGPRVDHATNSDEAPLVSLKEPRRKRDMAKFRQRQEIEFWNRIFNDPVGRRIMWELLADAHPLQVRPAFAPNGSPSPEASWIFAGESAVGTRWFAKLMRLARPGFLRMLDEHDQATIEHNKLTGNA